MPQPTIIHDTYRIIDANQAACDLFRCGLADLVDQPLDGGVYGADMRWLIRLRMHTIRERGELPARNFPFLRVTGSVFWAEAKTRRRDDGLWETTLKYLDEY